MLRIWSEHLSYTQARQPEVLDLLEHHDMHPIFAVPPGADLEALAALMLEAQKRGLEPGLWPLLADEDGYWPSERNVDAYFRDLHKLLDTMSTRYGVHVPWIAVDLEPPLQQVDMLRHATSPTHTIITKLLRENLNPSMFEQSIAQFAAGKRALTARGVRTLAVALPMAAHDLRDGTPLWQDIFETPWSPVHWDVCGIMAYGSMVSGYSQGILSEDDARAIHYKLFLRIASTFGARAHASLGVTGIGKLGDEPIYTNPQALALDASAARAAGIHDLAIFCLEGIIGREDAGMWLDAVRYAPAIVPPMTPKARLTRWGGATVRHIIKFILKRTQHTWYNTPPPTPP